ncbi:hypothetical protein ACFLQX_00800 [Bacteroidota bacterium]
MKSTTKHRFTFLLFSITTAILIGFTSCEEEEPVAEVTVEEYKNELSLLVSSEKVIVQNTTNGYNAGEIFASDSLFDVITGDYLDSLIVAEGIIAKPDVTFEDLYYANLAITEVGRRFHGEVFIADKRALNDLIGECDTLRVHTSVGTGPGEAPLGADTVFAASITVAKIIRDDAANSEFGQSYKRNQRQVDAEVDVLNADFAVYKAAIN